MSTFLAESLENAKIRWQEVDLLIQVASDPNSTSPALHDVLCRSAVVLICGHLEGFFRDVAKSIVQDLNANCRFEDLPGRVKKTFTSSFLSSQGTKEGATRQRKLSQCFEVEDVRLTPEPFLALNPEGRSKNPSPKVISRICANFGVNNIFSWLSESRLDLVFTDSHNEVRALRVEIETHLAEATSIFPYRADASLFGFDVAVEIPRRSRSLVEEFLDDLLNQRHRIAHGQERDSALAASSVAERRLVVDIVEQAAVLLLCSQIAERLAG